MNRELHTHYQKNDGVWLPKSSAPSMAEFTYSDGEEIERRIYEAITSASDKSLFSRELMREAKDWASTYHLSAVRSNLLRPLKTILQGRILELGAGCGAITRYLGELGAEVTAVEGSLARARIASARASDLSNVNVVCDRIESFASQAKFDVVTLIGVLEYARAFAPYAGFTERELLGQAVSHLADEGLLILAIENQFGLKYLAGAVEDHVQVPYFGVNDNYRSNTVITFGLDELKGVLSDAGLVHQSVFIPLPDYKLPISVLSPEGATRDGLFDAEAQLAQSVFADLQRPVSPPFSLERAWGVACRNGLAQDLANSFLIVASRTDQRLSQVHSKKSLAWHFSLARAPAFTKQAEFVSEGDHVFVRRSRVTNAQLPAVPLENIIADEPYIPGKNWWLELVGALNEPNWGIDTLGCWAKPWMDLVARHAHIKDIAAIGIHETVDGALFDATPFNAIMDADGQLRFFDQEWRVKAALEIGFVLFRGIRDSILRINSCSQPRDGTPHSVNRLVMAVLAHNGVLITRNEVERYLELELRIQKWVIGELDEAIDHRSVKDSWNVTLSIRPPSHNTNHLVAERNRLLAERDDIRAERDRLVAAQAELQKSRAQLEMDRAELQANLTTQIAQLANQKAANARLKKQERRSRKQERQARKTLRRFQQSTSWRAISMLQRGLERLPDPVRLALRRGAKGVWWALTPHKIPERIASLRTRKQSTVETKPQPQSVPVAAKRTKQQYLSFQPDPTGGQSTSPADRNGQYVLQAHSSGYTYVPPRQPDDLDAILEGLLRRPRFSIVVPTYNTTADLLSRMVASVEAQWYPNWELIIADDASPLPETREFLESIRNPQVEVLLLDKNSGISGATNAALQRATGDYVVFLDHDDELTQDCLYELALCINREEPDYIYSDEDKIDEEGRFTQPFFKPSWSPDTLMSTMYTCHVSCVRRSLLQEVGLLRTEFNGSQDWDLVLRVTERTKRIAHIPKVLYHWRIIPGSASGSLSAKSYAIKTSRSAREAALKRRGQVGSLEPIEQVPGHFRVRYGVTGTPLISVIIPSRNNGLVLERCLDSLFLMSSWRNFEVVVLDNGSDDAETLNVLRELAERDSVRVVRHDAPFNYSELNNIGVREAKGEILLFLNDDTELLTHDGLERMAGYAQLPHIGAVGAKLLYPEVMQVQHAGVLNLLPGPSHAFLRKSPDEPGYFMRNLLEYNWVAVTGACLMVERTKYAAVGGFDERFPVAYNDVELCFRLLKHGLYNVVCPSVRLLHYESLSRGNDFDNPEKRARLNADRYRLYATHPDFLMHDPFYSPNLHPSSVNFDLPA
ncbi:glycosyltransferase [Microvirga lotononidis]|uniref:Putative glycosyltransferase n=1 Tax=Microvirga lotononidis TaxID=864069 RepID=I4YQC9_9HYPH|nr:glycosyltransferase [Microvirga lotononidis]EIM26171.1 putative glycosyltransferase [Microvirga lotononidis]WQO26073.1 glycosyltransferase [Microvirga lotononidis]